MRVLLNEAFKLDEGLLELGVVLPPILVGQQIDLLLKKLAETY